MSTMKSYPTSHIPQRSWEERFQALTDYKKKHGNCNVPCRYKLDTGLGLFVSKLKTGRINITTDQRDRLSRLDFDWETGQKRHDRCWMEMFTKLETRTDGLHISKDDQKLYRWANHQRQLKTKGTLRSDRESKLNDIGFFESNPNSGNKKRTMKNYHSLAFTEMWMDKYQQLKNFYEENGHSMVPYKYNKQDQSLGAWVRTQRLRYKDGDMNETRIGLLNEVEFVWKINNLDPSASLFQKGWDAMYDLLKDYRENYGDVKVPKDCVYQEHKLGAWLHCQRTYKRSGRLDPLRAGRLLSIGVEWNYSNELWNKYYKMLKKFKKKHGHCRTPQYQDDQKRNRLSRWMSTQIDLHKSGILSLEYKQKLNRLGFLWDEQEPTAPSSSHLVDKRRMETRDSHHLTFEDPTKVVAQEETIVNVVREDIMEALKKAPNRSMRIKHMRRYLRKKFNLPKGSNKRILQKSLIQGLQNLEMVKILENEKMIILL